MFNRRSLDATFIGLKGRVLVQVGKWLNEPDMENAGRASITRSKIQQAAADQTPSSGKNSSH